MQLTTNKILCIGCITGISALAQSDVFQLAVPGPGEPKPVRNRIYVNGAPPEGKGFETKADDIAGTVDFIGGPAHTFEFVRSDMGSPSTVKNAPYSAEAVTENTRTLADGNRIVNSDRTTIARDSQGRTRRDISPSIPGINPVDAQKFSFIYDPGTNTSLTLNHNTHTATKSSGKSFTIQMFRTVGDDIAVGGVSTAARSAEAGRAEAGHVQAGRAETRNTMMITHNEAMPGMPGPPARIAVPGMAVPGMAAAGMAEGTAPTRTEDLGKEMIEGVMAEGTRSVTTIPAGQIGNERPIEIISERWYSPELQAVVLSKHIDPRFGENVYRLSAIRRTEPDKSLFEVPSSYAVQDGPSMGPERIILRKPVSSTESK